MGMSGSEAYCTLLVTDSYLPGALVLAHSLRDHGTKKQLAVLVTLETVSAASIEQLRTVYDQIIPVERISNTSPANLYLMGRPDLHSVFTKIALWKQTQFSKIVYIDADVVALRAPDELFARDSTFAAAPDVGWPDCFNSGVMGFNPNMGDYYAMLAMAQRGISFDGADQGLLNMHFGTWDRLSFTYNCTPTGSYQYVPAYRHFQSSTSLVHFIGSEKPWMIGREGGGGTGVYSELLGRWWAVYDRHFRGATFTYAPDQRQVPNWIVQQHVFGERGHPLYSDFQHPAPAKPTHQQTYSNSSPNMTEVTQAAALRASQASMATSSSAVETKATVDLDQSKGGSPSKSQEQPFEAPHSDWDPVREAPPTQSRPEAANFPSQTYAMSEDKNLFQPPKSYPEPPKNMWDSIPEAPPTMTEAPKPIFPWETSQPKATRVFAEEEKLTESEKVKPTPAPIDTSLVPVSPPVTSPKTPIIQVTPTESFGNYSRTNAWDDHPSIERYMSRFGFSRRTKAQETPSSSSDVSSPSAIEAPKAPRPQRPSFRLTDFPTEVERPSLPVTPAPVRRDMFWGEERGSEGALPAAAGVPQPADWDPLKKLEELQKRQSAMLEQGPRRPSVDAPQRAFPDSAALQSSGEEAVASPPRSPPSEGAALKDGKSKIVSASSDFASPLRF